MAAGSLPAFSSIIRSFFFFLTTSSVSRAWNWQKSLFRHSAKELRGLFQKNLSAVGGHLCSGLSSHRGAGTEEQAWPCHWHSAVLGTSLVSRPQFLHLSCGSTPTSYQVARKSGEDERKGRVLVSAFLSDFFFPWLEMGSPQKYQGLYPIPAGGIL